MTVQHIAGRVAAPPGSLGVGRGGAQTGGAAPPPGFDALLQHAARPAPRVDLTVSAHAAQRLEARGIDFSDAVRDRVGEALDALDAKGARDALLVGADGAFVVSVPNRTVVTALAPDEMRTRAVTQIDSAVLL